MTEPQCRYRLVLVVASGGGRSRQRRTIRSVVSRRIYRVKLWRTCGFFRSCWKKRRSLRALAVLAASDR